jgi:hypothetical protein
VGFLKRLLGGGPGGDTGEGGRQGGRGGDGVVPDAPPTPAGGAGSDLDEIERDRELLRAEALRLDNDLIQRQLRYASRAWTPPAQGGTRRADDGDRPAE